MAYLTIAAAFAGLLLAGVASAQSMPTLINATITAGTTTPSLGMNGVTLGTIALTATQSGEYGAVQVHSLPLTLTTSNGGNAGSLSGCQVFNANGMAISGDGVQPSGSSNVFTFETPLMLAGGQTQTLTVRCNVSASAPSGGTYQFSVGTPVLAASLQATLTPTPSLNRGAQDAVVGVLTLSAERSSRDVTVSSVPLTATLSQGATADTLSDCRVRLASDTSQVLTSGSNSPDIDGGLTTFRFDVPQTVPAGSMHTFVLTCDIDAGAPSNAAVDITLSPATITATDAVSDTAVIATRGYASGSMVTGPVSGTVRVSPTTTSGTTSTTSPTATTPPTTGGPSIPGVPNTGLGYGALLSLLASGLVIVFGSSILMRRHA